MLPLSLYIHIPWCVRKCVGGFLVGTSLMVTPLSYASPTGGEVVAGEGSITEGDITEVIQESQNLAVEWQTVAADDLPPDRLPGLSELTGEIRSPAARAARASSSRTM